MKSSQIHLLWPDGKETRLLTIFVLLPAALTIICTTVSVVKAPCVVVSRCSVDVVSRWWPLRAALGAAGSISRLAGWLDHDVQQIFRANCCSPTTPSGPIFSFCVSPPPLVVWCRGGADAIQFIFVAVSPPALDFFPPLILSLFV